MTPRPWTTDDRATLRRMAEAGYSDGEIARHLGRSRWAGLDQRHTLGLPRGCSAAMAAVLSRLAGRRNIAKAA